MLEEIVKDLKNEDRVEIEDYLEFDALQEVANEMGCNVYVQDNGLFQILSTFDDVREEYRFYVEDFIDMLDEDEISDCCEFSAFVENEYDDVIEPSV